MNFPSRMIFNCKDLAERKLQELKSSISKELSLGVIQIGEDKVSEVYIREKKKAAQKAGIGFNHYKFPQQVTFQDLKKEIKRLPDDGLIVQLPIKGEFNTQDVLNLVPFKKDVDGLSEISIGKLTTGRIDTLPPVVGAVDKILDDQDIKINGKTVAVIGPGRLVGKPMISYGLTRGATLIAIDENTKKPKSLSKKADIVVTGVGNPEFIDESFVKKGAVVIDAGTSKKDGKVVGDVDLDSVKNKVNLVTPVPGGVGPLTVVSLLENLVQKYAN